MSYDHDEIDYDVDGDGEYTNEYYCQDSFPNELTLHKSNSYMILKDDQIFKERDNCIKETIEFLSLDRDEAILILIFYSWSVDKVRDCWFEDIEGNCEKSGIQIDLNSNSTSKLKYTEKSTEKSTPCLVCYTPKDETFCALKCNHNFCGDCWGEYLSVKSEDFLVCLSTSCPQKGCKLIVPESLFYTYITNKDSREKFNKAVLKNFTGYNSDLKMCPGLSCNICIKCDSYASKEISCVCGTVFCFKCERETHRPCNCEIIEKWEKRSKSDTDNDKWINANTKTCPHCRNKIEKNQGCNYMLCNKTFGGCGKAFCYVCEVDWEKHANDHFKCNMYTPQVQEKENKQNKLKEELARYKFYLDRFINYTTAVKFAEKLIVRLEAYIDKIIIVKGLPLSELNFLKDALQTVISAKRSLKYTYIFGYYLKDGNEKKLFEYSQSFLERNSDNLHQLIEGDTLPLLIAEDNFEAFNKKFIEYKNTIVNLCFATTKYQKNLLSEIENTMMTLLNDNLLYEKV